MKRTLKYLMILVVVFSVNFIGCKKKVQPKLSEINKECDCAEEVSADFTIEELAFNTSSSFINMRTETETIYGYRNVRFYAKQEAESYKWIIGNDTAYTREVYRYFNETWLGQNIAIKLVVSKKPNRICFPNDNGEDSLTKTFYVLSLDPATTWDTYQPRFEGTFRMLEEKALDSIDIFIDFRFEPIMGLGNIIKVVNPEIPATNHEGAPFFGVTYRQIWRNDAGGNSSAYNLNLLHKNGKLTITYDWFKLKYHGRKL